MTDPVASLGLMPIDLHHTHPPTYALAQVQQPSADTTPTGGHRRSSSSHSHNTIVASTSTSTTPATATATATSTSTATATRSSSTRSSSRPSLAVTASPMPKLFKIEIASNGECKSSNPVFYPSDIIQGMVYLYLDKPMTLPALKIVFRGESNYPTSKQQDYLDHRMRRLFSVAMTLWGSREVLPEDQWGQLPAGDHIFPFTIQLPDKNLPASFDHPWLKNQYTLTAYYRRPNGLSKWQSKAKPINFMPLSTPGTEHGPIQESCPKMGTALLLAHPDLAPGGRVHVRLTAGAAIDRCQFALSRHIRARINESTYKEDEIICHYERRAIPKGEFSLVLPIPKITPPTTESSSALKITYSVQVSIWNERFFFKTESHNFDFPIVIRTLPSCDNRACEGLDWCEPSVDRPMFLTEAPIQPLPLYDLEQSPPKYTFDLPAYDQPCATSSSSSSLSAQSLDHQRAQEQEQEQEREQDQNRDQAQAQEQEVQDREGDAVGDHAADDASIRSIKSIDSEIEGHECLVPDHPHPHSPSCMYYLSPRDDPVVPFGSDASSHEHASSVDQQPSASIQNGGPSQSGSQGPTHTHARAVDYFKIQTMIEPA